MHWRDIHVGGFYEAHHSNPRLIRRVVGILPPQSPEDHQDDYVYYQDLIGDVWGLRGCYLHSFRVWAKRELTYPPEVMRLMSIANNLSNRIGSKKNKY